MSLPRYPEYKDSGVEWLGAVPAHWLVTSLKRGFAVCLGKMLKPDATSPDDEYLPYLRAANIQWSGVDVTDVKSMWFSPWERQQLLLQRGDLLVSEGGDVGRSAVWDGELEPCYFQNSVNRIRPRGKNSTKYAYYWMSVLKEKGFIDVLCNKSTIAHFTAEKVQAVPMVFPPFSEQEAVCNFLDGEVLKIDGLISEQEKLIALLKEKRQAVISHAVTKGLDPNVPMKDSGIEWLGEVPVHWEVAPLKRDVLFLTSGSRGWAEHYVDDGAIFIRIGNLKRESIDLDLSDIQRVSVPEGAEGERTRLAYGDVLFSITAYLGSVAVVPAEFEPAYVSQHVALVRLKQNQLLPEWGAYVALSIIGKTYLASQGYGGTKIQLSLGDVANIPMTIPPIPEQRLIINAVAGQLNKMDALIEEASTVISLLRERRSALISAAVTGKINVCDKENDGAA